MWAIAQRCEPSSTSQSPVCSVTDVKNTSNNTSNKVNEYVFVFELEGEVFATYDHEDKGCNSHTLNCDTLFIQLFLIKEYCDHRL